LLTVSKNLMPYSSARACPLAVGTACISREKGGENEKENVIQGY
jgi:hypothetical protein